MQETHHVNPRPAIGVVSPIHPSHADQRDDKKDGSDTGPPDGKHGATNALSPADFKPPNALEKLAVYDDAHEGAVGGKEEIIESHRRLGGVRMPVGVLGFDGRGVEEGGGGEGVAEEAEDVEGGEVDCEAEGGFAEVVGYGLGVERKGPG